MRISEAWFILTLICTAQCVLISSERYCWTSGTGMVSDEIATFKTASQIVDNYRQYARQVLSAWLHCRSSHVA